MFGNRFSFVNKSNEMRARGAPRAGLLSNYQRRGGSAPHGKLARNQDETTDRAPAAEDALSLLSASPNLGNECLSRGFFVFLNNGMLHTIITVG